MAQNEQNKLNEKLIEAVGRGNTEQVRELLDAGADINIQDKFGETALMRAAAWGHTGVMELLIRAGAEIDRPNKYGWTALMVAAAWGHTGVMELLIRAGADPGIKNNEGRTAIDLLKECHPQTYERLVRTIRKKTLKHEDHIDKQSEEPDFNI